MTPPERISNPSQGSLSKTVTPKKIDMEEVADPVKFDELDGRSLDLIAAYSGERLPKFVLLNKKVCNEFLSYQILINGEVLTALNGQLRDSKKMPVSPSKKRFIVNEDLHDSFLSSVEGDYDELIALLQGYKLKQKDIVVLKLYLSFMEIKFSERHEHLFMRQT